MLVVRELLRQKSVCRRVAPVVASVAISLLPLSLFLVLSRSRSLGTTARIHVQPVVRALACTCVSLPISLLCLSLSSSRPEGASFSSTIVSCTLALRRRRFVYCRVPLGRRCRHSRHRRHRRQRRQRRQRRKCRKRHCYHCATFNL